MKHIAIALLVTSSIATMANAATQPTEQDTNIACQFTSAAEPAYEWILYKSDTKNEPMVFDVNLFTIKPIEEVESVSLVSDNFIEIVDNIPVHSNSEDSPILSHTSITVVAEKGAIRKLSQMHSPSVMKVQTDIESIDTTIPAEFIQCAAQYI
jgi:hypothetical protein